MPMTRDCTFETFIQVHLTFHFLFMPKFFVFERSTLTSFIKLLCLESPKGGQIVCKLFHLMLCLLERTAFHTFIHFCLYFYRSDDL